MKQSDSFNMIVRKICTRSPLQKKKLKQYLAAKDERFFQEAEEFAIQYIGYLNHEEIPLNYVVDSYLKMCQDMMNCQIEFMKTGKYTIDIHSEAYKEVYNNPERMKSYMLGLAISQFLWPTHYAMYNFFANNVEKLSPNIRSYLEIGPGHGLFFNKALECLGKDVEAVGVDISPMSISITRSIMEYCRTDFLNIEYHNVDILKFDSDKKYDFITMGEVLEHVNCPDKLLYKLKELLTSEGKAFVSTCVNAPAIDHVYHFKSVDEIRSEIDNCGLLIKDEKVLPAENLPLKEIEEKKIAVNYCAILGRN